MEFRGMARHGASNVLSLLLLWQLVSPPTDLRADVDQPMAISFSTLTSGSSTSNGASTASVSPTANALVVLVVAQSVAGGGATDINDTLAVSGNGITWTEVSQTIFAVRRNLWVFVGSNASPSTGSITLTFSSGNGSTFEQMKWSVSEATGVDVGGTPIGTAYTTASSGTAATVTVSETPGSGDFVFAAFALEDNNTPSLNAELDTTLHSFGDTTGARRLTTAYDSAPDSSPTPGITWTGTTGYGGVAFVVNASAGAAATSFPFFRNPMAHMLVR